MIQIDEILFPWEQWWTRSSSFIYSAMFSNFILSCSAISSSKRWPGGRTQKRIGGGRQSTQQTNSTRPTIRKCFQGALLLSNLVAIYRSRISQPLWAVRYRHAYEQETDRAELLRAALNGNEAESIRVSAVPSHIVDKSSTFFLAQGVRQIQRKPSQNKPRPNLQTHLAPPKQLLPAVKLLPRPKLVPKAQKINKTRFQRFQKQHKSKPTRHRTPERLPQRPLPNRQQKIRPTVHDRHRRPQPQLLQLANVLQRRIDHPLYTQVQLQHLQVKIVWMIELNTYPLELKLIKD